MLSLLVCILEQGRGAAWARHAMCESSLIGIGSDVVSTRPIVLCLVPSVSRRPNRVCVPVVLHTNIEEFSELCQLDASVYNSTFIKHPTHYVYS